ncbi:Organic cation/carnitine transporter 4 [Zostera marina]|uniref:H(+)/Pi cotransporter n=1 Tax=Zostera marina TaxID=29655 RepID=A0A0K9PCE1_ZOSMR|nr:Organic cation/carnitine transporter 4 [Zostera marina]
MESNDYHATNLSTVLLVDEERGEEDFGSDSEKERIGIDEILTVYTGEFGKWQKIHFVLTSLAWALEALHTMVMIFTDQEPFTSTPNICDVEPSFRNWSQGSGSSTVSEFGLVCGKKYQVGLVQSMFFAGCMIGSGIFGHLSDSFMGRKGCLTVVSLMNFMFGFLTAFSQQYWVYCLLRFLTGISTGGVGLCAFVLATEPIGPSKRGQAGMSTFYFFSMGFIIVAGMGYVCQSSWRLLYVVTSIPSLLFLLFVLPFISESPRWYLVKGKLSETMVVMNAIARTNGKPDIPARVIPHMDNDDDDDDYEEINQKNTTAKVSFTILDVIRSPVTRWRLILAVAINFMCSIVYYGLSLNVINLKTNIYFSVVLNSLAEIPAYMLTTCLLGTFGRKPLTIGSLWLSGVFCIAGSLMGTTGKMKMVCGMLGIFGISGTYNLLFVYTTELFPTVVRNTALGCISQASQMGAILAPIVVLMGETLPFQVFGLCGIVGGIIAFYLPETKDKPLYDTIAGMEFKV